jgi:hypothetical protein
MSTFAFIQPDFKYLYMHSHAKHGNEKRASKTLWLYRPPFSVIPVEGGGGMIVVLCKHSAALPETGTQCQYELAAWYGMKVMKVNE